MSVTLVDGGLQEWETDETILEMLRALRRDGFSGRALIDELLTDDWTAPPSVVTISGTLANGECVRESVSYE